MTKPRIRSIESRRGRAAVWLGSNAADALEAEVVMAKFLPPGNTVGQLGKPQVYVRRASGQHSRSEDATSPSIGWQDDRRRNSQLAGNGVQRSVVSGPSSLV